VTNFGESKVSSEYILFSFGNQSSFVNGQVRNLKVGLIYGLLWYDKKVKCVK